MTRLLPATLIVDSLEWDGPIVVSWPTAAHQRIFSSQDAKEVIAKFAERAWHRPVQVAEVAQLMGPLSGHELASRLSYFLWSTMLDQRLLDLARDDKLQQSLGSEVKRMLADSKATASWLLNAAFAADWQIFQRDGRLTK